MSAPDVLEAARQALAAGLCPVPPRENGSKAPEGCWKEYQTRRPTAEELEAWWGANGRSGLGIVCGAVSGGLELFEFEGRAVAAGVPQAFQEAGEAAGLGELLERITAGFVVGSPSGGYHLFYRCPEPRTTKLASTPDHEPLIETKGEGGYCITAPSNGGVHPTGGRWILLRGGFETIATITAEEHEELHRLARTFDRRPPEERPLGAGQGPGDGAGTGRPGEDFNRRASWAQVLEPHGWRLVYESGGVGHWRRPGKATGISATTGYAGTELLYVFTTSTALEAERSYSKFGAHAALAHGGDFAAAAAELRRAGYGGDEPEAGPSSAGELPEEFWASRPALAHIRRAAHSRQRSAPAVLHAVLARLAAITPHTYRLPAIVGAPATLSYFAAVVAPPGTGKSGTNDIAAELLPVPPGRDVADQLPLGSGEGLAEVLFDVVEEAAGGKTVKVKRQVRHGALVFADEGRMLADLGRREGSSLLPTLRTIWSGGTIGQNNAAQERRRIVPAGTYTFGVIVALQPETAAALLDDAAGGTPQRFAWTWGIDPAVPDRPPPWPGPLPWAVPHPGEEERGRLALGAFALEVADPIKAELRAADLARVRGQAHTDTLDAHGGLLRLKAAGLLALLDGRLSVTEEDWALAGILKAASDAARAAVVSFLAAERARRRAEERQAKADTAVSVEDAKRRWRILNCARKVVRRVHGEPNGLNVTAVRRQLTREDRDVLEDALEVAIAEGWITEESEPGQGTAQRVLRPGPTRPL